MSKVFWFLGLSASGKTTIADAVREYLLSNPQHFPSVSKWEVLDGDVLRSFLGNEIGYSFAERRKSVKVMGLIAKKLSENGIGVIVANISPFQDLRDFFRSNIENYYEIYCKCSLESCISRDPKGHYKKQLNEGIHEFIGLDIPFQQPSSPDLVLDTENNTLDQSLEQFIEFINKLEVEGKND